MGSDAAAVKKKLPVNAEYIRNDDSTGTVAIQWDGSSMNQVVASIKGSSAIGKSYVVTGTITVDGEKHSVRCNVLIDPENNLLQNGNFDVISNGDVAGWTRQNGSILYANSDNPRNKSAGCFVINIYDAQIADLSPDENGCYSASISQTITITEPGVYEARAFFEGLDKAGSRTGEAIYITAECGGQKVISEKVVLDGWMS